jgi:aminoglycoside 6'-N-acetyltransferase I
VVAPACQRRSVGSALLGRLEARAHDDGILTLFLGSDDDYGGTSLHGRDLWPDILGHAATVAVTERGHALTFYCRHGYRMWACCRTSTGPDDPTSSWQSS